MLSELKPEELREFAFAAADLLATTDAYGRILTAYGDGALLHHPTADRLVGKEILPLISQSDIRRLRDDLWALGPGRRVCWDDPGAIEGGRRIVVQRNTADPNTFSWQVARTPRSGKVRSERASEMLSERFRGAIASGRLKAARQPIVDTTSLKVSHYEVLARFEGEDSPAGLICAAEETGQIAHLDYIMVHAACARLSAIPDAAFRLAVNISGESVQRLEIVRELCAVIAGHEFQRDRLILEVTESARIQDAAAAARGISMLRRQGVQVALDDFGAGAASFAYLRDFEVDGLKFDGSFLRASPDNPRSMALIRGVARMCADLNIASVGECVETAADHRLLADAGVRYAQGYLFGRPIIDEQFFVKGRTAQAMAAA